MYGVDLKPITGSNTYSLQFLLKKTASFVYMINIIIFNTIFPLEHVFIRIVIHEEKSSMKNVFLCRGEYYFSQKKMKLSIWTLFRYVLKTKFYMN